MQRAAGGLTREQRRSLLSWLTRGNHFWDAHRLHDESDWLECRGEIVTDSAVGEAAFRTDFGDTCDLLSATPTSWNYSPVVVDWRDGSQESGNRRIAVENWWEADALAKRLQETAPPVGSWDQLHEVAVRRFPRLWFAEDCFEPLTGYPFAHSSCDRILDLFRILNEVCEEVDDCGEWTPRGRELIRKYFTGSGAWFSDSSFTERNRFKRQLTFSHPRAPERRLLYPWHGKERRMTLRVHFAWPVPAGRRIDVVYVGPKLTKA